jgi:ABC-type glycerol-3-phosphate transport system permease component
VAARGTPLNPGPLSRIIATTILGATLALFALPLLSAVSASLNTGAQIVHYPPVIIPKHPAFSNYVTIWTDYPMWHWFLNSFILCVTIVAGQLITSSMAGYTFAKLRFRGRERTFFLYMATMLIPSQVLIIPIFVMVTKMHLINNLWGLIIPSLAGAFGTFFFRQFYLSIPDDIMEAAQLDGAGPIRTYLSIFVPMSGSPFATFGIISFLSTWNSFLWPLILLRDPNKYPVTLGLSWLQGADLHNTVNWQIVAAANVTSAVPAIIFFFLAQKQLVRGLSLGTLGSR